MSSKTRVRFFGSTVLALAVVLLLALWAPPRAKAAVFPDVPDWDSQVEAIIALSENGVISGNPDGTFQPRRTITRAECVVLLYRAQGRESDVLAHRSTTKFKDVPDSHWAAKYISLACDEGTVSGNGKGAFNPDGKMTYEQIVTLVAASLGHTTAEANAKGGYPAGWVAIGEAEGLGKSVSGYTGKPAGRGDVAQVIFNAGYVAAAPKSSAVSGTFDYQFKFSFEELSQKGATVYYTTDGSEPTVSSSVYSGALPIERSTTVKAFALNSMGKQSKTVTYKFSLPKYDTVYEKCEQIIAQTIRSGMTELEKEKALHDYLVLNYTYDIDNYNADTIPMSSYEPYGLLVNGRGVCQAYAETTQLLMNMVGIECKIVTGFADGITANSSHAWNIVKIDGVYYQLDTTWDDPVPDLGTVRYDYFNISDATIGKDHRWERSGSPACNSDMDKSRFMTSGTVKIYLPDITGYPRDTAVEYLSSLGFYNITVTETASDYAAGTVLTQYPYGGSTIDKSAAVTLTVSTGRPEKQDPNQPDDPQTLPPSNPSAEDYSGYWQELTAEQADALHNSGNDAIIVYYSRYCGYSQAYVPLYKAAAKAAGVTIYGIDHYNENSAGSVRFPWKYGNTVYWPTMYVISGGTVTKYERVSSQAEAMRIFSGQ